MSETSLWFARESWSIFLNVNFSTASRRLNRLEELGLVESAVMGASLPAAKRYRLPPAGAACFLEPEVYFHTSRNINRLAEMLPAVESFYPLTILLASCVGAGKFQSFHWRLRDGLEAVARFEHGTIAFVWSGPWQKKKDLMSRLEQFDYWTNRGPCWPDLVCVTASDHWQAHEAVEALTSFGVRDTSLVYCSETRHFSHLPTFAARQDLPLLRPLLGANGNTVPTQLPRMMQGVRAGRDASKVYQILYLVEQFPGAEIASIGRALGSHPRYVSPTVACLVAEEMLVQADGHLYLSDKALTLAAHRDRIHVSRPRSRFGLKDDGLPSVARHRSHDGAAFRIVSVFKGAGFPVAGGWRGKDYSGGKNAIAPDAMIFTREDSSIGRTWWFLEYERRASSAAGIAKKLRGYLARRPMRPVLVAARNASMAAEFRRQADAVGYPLLAASIDVRIEAPQNVWGPNTVWCGTVGRSATFLPPA